MEVRVIFGDKAHILDNMYLGCLRSFRAESLCYPGNPLAVMIDLTLLARKSVRVLIQEVVDLGVRLTKCFVTGSGVICFVHHIAQQLDHWREE